MNFIKMRIGVFPQFLNKALTIQSGAFFTHYRE